MKYFSFIHFAHRESPSMNFQNNLRLHALIRSLKFLRSRPSGSFVLQTISHEILCNLPSKKVCTYSFYFLQRFWWYVVSLYPIHDDSVMTVCACYTLSAIDNSLLDQASNLPCIMSNNLVQSLSVIWFILRGPKYMKGSSASWNFKI